MAELIVRSPNGVPERVVLSRLRTTIGRSARSDVSIPDAFASRLHAEIRKEGDFFVLYDLGSANGTRLNSIPVAAPMRLVSGSEIQIGETVLAFQHVDVSSNSSRLITDSSGDLDPSVTIAFSRRPNPTAEILSKQTDVRSDLLSLISKVGVTLLSSKSLEDTLNQIVSLVFEAVPASRCVIMLRDSNNELKVSVARDRTNPELISEVRISRTIMDEVINHGKSVLTADAQHDPKFASQTISLQGIRSVLAVPLQAEQTDAFGIIYADSPTHEVTFSEDHLNILTTLASVASIRVENARLLEARFEQERLERELALATEIQQTFQPSSTPKLPGFEFQGISFSCYEIGGDYYDFIPLSDDRVFVALGDVSGKGTAAALLMSSVHAAIHAQVCTQESLATLVCAVNEYLAKNTPSNRFVTLFVGVLDTKDGSFKYINAGHNPPLVWRKDNTIEELSSGGFPLGLIPTAEYEEAQTTFDSGEGILIFSDGVSEANNALEEEFGMDRLKNVVTKYSHLPAAGLRDKLESSLSEFTSNTPANDDITMVIVKRTA